MSGYEQKMNPVFAAIRGGITPLLALKISMLINGDRFRNTGISSTFNAMGGAASIGGALGGGLGSYLTDGSVGGSYLGMAAGGLSGLVGAYLLGKIDAKRRLRSDLKEEKEMYNKYKAGEIAPEDVRLPGTLPALSRATSIASGVVGGAAIPAMVAIAGKVTNNDVLYSLGGIGTGLGAVLGGMLGYRDAAAMGFNDLKAMSGRNFARGKALALDAAGVSPEEYKAGIGDGPDPLYTNDEEYEEHMKKKKEG